METRNNSTYAARKEAARQYTGKAGKCITTVTLERGWA